MTDRELLTANAGPTEFDPASYLTTEDARAAFLAEFEGDSAEIVAETLCIVRRSRILHPASQTPAKEAP